jgi:addiction module HigA family antidote
MPLTPIHPGEILAEELDALNMTAATAAVRLHVPPNRLYQILRGKRALTADTALRLARWLGTSAAFWVNLQALYDLRLAEQQVGKQIRATIRPRREKKQKEAGKRSSQEVQH